MFARQLILAWVLLGILAHSYNSCTCKAETGGERVPGQPGLPVKPNIKKKEGSTGHSKFPFSTTASYAPLFIAASRFSSFLIPGSIRSCVLATCQLSLGFQ